MQKATLQKLEKVGTVRAKSWFSALMRIWLDRLFSFFKAEEMCHVVRRYDTELLSPIEDRLIHR
jgi:hypothetical protein